VSAPPGQPDTTTGLEAEGRRIATALDECGSAIVVGDDPAGAAEVALGIARAQARRRRVAVVDLIG
jgi:hypothetical protein